jgi:methionyl-tRNA formyltransferase
MGMEPGLDTGPVLLERRLSILPTDTAGTLTERLADEGGRAIVEALARLDELVPRPQTAEGVTYASKIDKSEAVIDWHLDAAELDRRIRAFNPFPGAETTVGEEPLKIWEAQPVDVTGVPGTVVSLDAGRPVVACGRGGLALTVLQRSGSKRMNSPDFLKGRPMPPGTSLGGSRVRNA